MHRVYNVMCIFALQSHLSGLSEEAFSSHKKALEVKRTEKPKKLNEECRRYWSEIMAGMYHFNRGQLVGRSVGRSVGQSEHGTIYFYLCLLIFQMRRRLLF